VNELALFAGAGGGILGGKLLGWRTVCAVELDPYARRVLLARQADPAPACLDSARIHVGNMIVSATHAETTLSPTRRTNERTISTAVRGHL
jgi:site-specific DNA-cytosine methylase